MLNDLIDELNRLMGDPRILIYDITNNDSKLPKITKVEGVFRTTSGLITRTDKGNVTNYNFKIDFAVPVDDKDFRHEIEDVLKTFRTRIDNLRYRQYRLLPSIEVAIGNEYSYRNKSGEFHDYVTYYIVGTLEENNDFVGSEGVTITLKGKRIDGILTIVPTLTNNHVKNTIVKPDLKNQFKLNDYVRAWTITLNASDGEGCKLIYSLFSTPKDELLPFTYKWIDNNKNVLIDISTNVKIVSIDLAQSYGLITGLTLKVVESL